MEETRPNWDGVMGMHCGRRDRGFSFSVRLVFWQVMTAWGALSSACQGVLLAAYSEMQTGI